MASDKQQIIIQCSGEFKEAIASYAQVNRQSLTAVVKRAIANYITYANIESELKRAPRTPKYDSPEEQAQLESWRRGLRAWATKAIPKYLKESNVELASAIAIALDSKDYESLDEIKEGLNPETVTE